MRGANMVLAFCLALAPLLEFGVAASAGSDEPEPKWGPSLEFEAKPGNERTLGDIDLFVPLWQDDRSMIFGNLRGTGDTDENWEGNVGLGYRTILYDRWIVGGYGYLDYRRSENDNGFIQGTFGVEALSVDWDFRANGYIPESGAERVNDLTRAEVVGNQLFVREGLEQALHGFNAEAGWRLPLEAAEVRVYGGGYWFDADGADTVAGPRGRLEVRLNDLEFFGPGSRLTLGVEGQWDDPRGGQVFGLVRLRIPLGGSARRGRGTQLSALERRMVERVERDVDIVVQAANGRQEPAVIDGRVVSSVHSVGPGGDLENTVETASGPNGLVIVDGTVTEDNTVDMQPGQILAGGGATFAVIGANSGATTTFTTPGAAGTIDNTTTLNDVVHLASNTTVTGLTINGGFVGVRGDQSDNVSLSDITVTNTLAAGITVFDSGNASLSNVTVTNVGSNGINLFFSDNASLNNVTVTNAGTLFASGNGIRLSGSDNASLNNVTVTNVGVEGIILSDSDNASLNNITVTNALFGITVFDSGNASLSNVTVTNAGLNGINLFFSDNASLNNVTVTNGGFRSGIFVSTAGNVTLNNVTVTNVSGNGIDLVLSGVSLNNVTVTNVGVEGIFLSDGIVLDSATASLNNVTINSPTGDGIEFRGTVDSPTGSGNTVTNPGGLVCNNQGTVTNSTLLVNGQPCP